MADVVTALAAILTDRLVDIPCTPAGPLDMDGTQVVVSRVGGGQKHVGVDDAEVQFEVLGDSYQTTSELADSLFRILEAIRNVVHDDREVKGVAPDLNVWLPDAKTSQPRFLVTAAVTSVSLPTP